MIVFYLQLFAHFLADYYLQTSKMAQEKLTNKLVLVEHVAIIYGTSLVFLIPFFNLKNVIIMTIVATIHFGIDYCKCYVVKKGSNDFLYTIDQLLHISVLVLATCFFDETPIAPLQAFYDGNYETIKLVVQFVLMTMIIHRPISLTIVLYYLDNVKHRNYNPFSYWTESSILGFIERIIYVIALYFHIYYLIPICFLIKLAYVMLGKKKSKADLLPFYKGSLVSLLITLFSYGLIF